MAGEHEVEEWSVGCQAREKRRRLGQANFESEVVPHLLVGFLKNPFNELMGVNRIFKITDFLKS